MYGYIYIYTAIYIYMYIRLDIYVYMDTAIYIYTRWLRRRAPIASRESCPARSTQRHVDVALQKDGSFLTALWSESTTSS